jgi:hypothetical protein
LAACLSSADCLQALLLVRAAAPCVRIQQWLELTHWPMHVPELSVGNQVSDYVRRRACQHSKAETHSAVAQQWTIRLLLAGHLHGSELSRCMGLTILLAALCIICGCSPFIGWPVETASRMLFRDCRDPLTSVCYTI